jgi:hypothetical protein
MKQLRPLTIAEHRTLGAELHRAYYLLLGMELTNRYPKSSPAAKAYSKTLHHLTLLRGHLEASAVQQLGQDGNEVSRLYFPGRKPKR